MLGRRDEKQLFSSSADCAESSLLRQSLPVQTSRPEAGTGPCPPPSSVCSPGRYVTASIGECEAAGNTDTWDLLSSEERRRSVKLSAPLLWLPVIYDANRTNVSVFSSPERLRRLMQHQNHMSEKMRSRTKGNIWNMCCWRK